MYTPMLLQQKKKKKKTFEGLRERRGQRAFLVPQQHKLTVLQPIINWT